MVNLISDFGPRGKAWILWTWVGWGYLESLGSVDGSKGPKYSEYSQNLYYRDCTGAGEGAVLRPWLRPCLSSGGMGWVKGHLLDAKRDEGHTDHQQIQQIEPTAAEGALVQEGPEHRHLGKMVEVIRVDPRFGNRRSRRGWK